MLQAQPRWGRYHRLSLDVQASALHPHDARSAVARYLGDRTTSGMSARGVLGRIRRAHDRDAAPPAGTGAAHRRRERPMVAAARCGRPARARHPDAGRSDRANSAPAAMVDSDRRTRHGRRAPCRSTFCGPSGADRACPRTGCASPFRAGRAVGTAASSARGRRLARTVSRTTARLFAQCVERLRSCPVLAVPARVHRDTACLPEGGGTPDPVGNRRAELRVVVTDHR